MDFLPPENGHTVYNECPIFFRRWPGKHREMHRSSTATIGRMADLMPRCTLKTHTHTTRNNTKKKLGYRLIHYRSRDVALWRSANRGNRCYLAAQTIELRGSWVLALTAIRCCNKGNFEETASLVKLTPSPPWSAPSRAEASPSPHHHINPLQSHHNATLENLGFLSLGIRYLLGNGRMQVYKNSTHCQLTLPHVKTIAH